MNRVSTSCVNQSKQPLKLSKSTKITIGRVGVMEQRLMVPPTAAHFQSEMLNNESLHQKLSSSAPQFQYCIEACLQCFESCEQAIVYLSHKENTDPQLIRLLNDAVEISQVSATFMLRGSNFHIRTCAVCAEVTKICAEKCEAALAETDDELLRSCVNVLRKCAECCFQMAHHH